MDDEITVIKNVKVRYLTTKMDKYDNEIIQEKNCVSNKKTIFN